MEGDPLGFSTSAVAKLQKIEGGPFGEFFRKSLTMPKKVKGGTLYSRPVLYVTRKKRKKHFGSIPWANRYNLSPKIL